MIDRRAVAFVACALLAAVAVGACDSSASSDAASACTKAAAAVCNAATECGDSGELGLASCDVGMVWISTDVCIAQLAQNCGADAAATPVAPSIPDPTACTSALPFVCSRGLAVIPASCVTCVVGPDDAG